MGSTAQALIDVHDDDCVWLTLALGMTGESGGNAVGGSGGVCSALAGSVSRQPAGCMGGWHAH